MLHPEPEHVALVTGATRGVGKGVALALADAGFVVYVTGRSATQADLGRDIVPVVCDTTDAAAVERVCERISVVAWTCWSTAPGVGTSGWSKMASSPGPFLTGDNRSGGGTP
jgi:short-subunit dehydrogenase